MKKNTKSKSKIKVITHNGGFHTDDCFAVATLLLYLGHEESEVIRTRDPEIIKTGDYVVDVGFVYDPDKNLFDHHQKGGAGVRKNGIPYASFGLVWKKFGEKVCSSKEVFEAIDRKVAQPIDGLDNGTDLFRSLFDNIYPYTLGQITQLFEPTWKEGNLDVDKQFLESVSVAKKILKREIKVTKDWFEAEVKIKEVYEKTEDKRLIVLEKNDTFGRSLVSSTLSELPEPLFLVLHKHPDDTWQVVAVNKEKGTFDIRKPFPENWRGKLNNELIKETGISDAMFCHNSGFMCITKSKKGAIKLAKLALEN